MFTTMSGETKLILGVIITSVLLLIGAVFFFSTQSQTQTGVQEVAFTREELLPSTTSTKGSASASALLVEFSDFQCPACKSFAPIVRTLADTYGDRLVIGYRHYPLPQHSFAQKAAQAAEAASKQGKFWEMHDKLFENQDKLNDQTLSTIVKELELNEEQFKKDIESSEIKSKINTDIAEGNRFRVNATPTFFLNGKKLTLRSAEDLTKAVKDIVE